MWRKCKQKYCHLVNPRILFSGFLEKAEATLHPRDRVLLLLLGRGEHKGPSAGLRSAKLQRISGWAGAVHGHQEGRADELLSWGQQRMRWLPLTVQPRCPGHSLTWNSAGQCPAAPLGHSYCLFYLVGSSYWRPLQRKNLSNRQNLFHLTPP